MLLIKNGRVVDPVSGVDKVMDVLVDGGRIAAVGDKAAALLDEKDGTAQIIDASGLVVAPGLVDTHVHFRDPGIYL